MRVLLYKEDDTRRLLFDSNALQKVMHKDQSATSASISSTSTSGGGKFLKNEKYTSLQNGKIPSKSHSSNGSNFIEVCAEYGYKVSHLLSNLFGCKTHLGNYKI